MRRLINALTAALVIAVTTVPLGASAAVPCGNKTGFWTVLEGPGFKQGSQTITGLAVDPFAPDRVFATNGTELSRSTRYGCSWAPVFSVNQEASLQSPAGGSSVIKSIGMSERGAVPTYMLVEQHVGPLTRPRVFVGTNGGETWRVADAGLPPTGTPKLLRVAPSQPNTAYVVIDAAGAADLLFATNDGGNSWQLRSRRDSVIDLKVNPSNANDLWIGESSGLHHSTDGGSTSTGINEFTGKATGPIDVFHRGGKARIMAFIPGDGVGWESDDGGRTFQRINSPPTPQSIANGNLADQILLAAGNSVYGWAPTILNWVDLKPPLSGIRNIQSDTQSNVSYYGHTARQVAIFQGPVGSNIKIPKNVIEIPDISLIDVAPSDIVQQARLTPPTSKVKIAPGKSRTVKYDLTVPRTLTPLDVLFVIDTSSSMTQVIHEAAKALEEIHNGIVSSGAAVEFGLVDYRSYPTDTPPREPPGEVTDNYVYRRVLDIGATAAEMATGIEGLVAAGGGIYDAQLEALWQLATGSGQDVWPPGPSYRDVPAGLQASFRKKALKVVLHVGDEPFGSEDSDSDSDNQITRPDSQLAKPDIPEFEAVAAAMNAKDIKHLGLSLYPDATPDLRKMAQLTNAFAPPGGVDCDRDGKVDVQDGAPLVCVLRQDEIDDANMTPAIVELVEAIRTKANVSLDVEGSRDQVVRAVTPDSYSSVLLQADNALEFDVTYHCPNSLQGKSTDVELTGRGILGSAPIARTTVICGTIAEEEPRIPAIPFDQVLAFIPLLPLGPPPPPVNVSSATQAQAQAQANAAFAAQEQEQPQVAMVHQMHAEAKAALAREEEYSFTALRKQTDSPVPLYAAAVLMAGAYGAAMTLRQRTRLRFRLAKNDTRR